MQRRQPTAVNVKERTSPIVQVQYKILIDGVPFEDMYVTK